MAELGDKMVQGGGANLLGAGQVSHAAANYGRADYDAMAKAAQRQNNRRWAIEQAARVVGPADLLTKAREIVAFVEETPDAV